MPLVGHVAGPERERRRVPNQGVVGREHPVALVGEVEDAGGRVGVVRLRAESYRSSQDSRDCRQDRRFGSRAHSMRPTASIGAEFVIECALFPRMLCDPAAFIERQGQNACVVTGVRRPVRLLRAFN